MGKLGGLKGTTKDIEFMEALLKEIKANKVGYVPARAAPQHAPPLGGGGASTPPPPRASSNYPRLLPAALCIKHTRVLPWQAWARHSCPGRWRRTPPSSSAGRAAAAAP